MSIGRARTVALLGIDAVDVIVEAHVATGLPGFSVIGSSGAAAREAAERVRTALITVEASLARSKVLVSLAPADLPKVGARYDLAMAAAVLCQRGVVTPAAMGDTAFVGELALDGSVRPVSGVLPSAYHLLRAGVRRLVVASANAAEGRTATGLEIVGVRSLSDAVAALTGQPASEEDSGAGENGWAGEDAASGLGVVSAGSSDSGAAASGATADLADVRGQHMARRALEIAAAGAHHMLLLGPPGCGKSMLAARLPGLLPPLSDEEAFQLAAIRSVLGRLDSTEVLDRRAPLSAPHHTISASALLGGGSGVARPGQLSLASGGVLFLDELFEWPRHVLDALREPLEEGLVRVARSKATVVYPARVQLICAANPCPCGGRTGADGGCECAPETVWRYRAKLSGPLADRLDLAPAVEPLRARDLDGPPGETSAAVAERVSAARAASIDRCGVPAARAPTRLLRAQLDGRAAAALARAVDRQDLTGRGHDRCLAVARTIADLAGGETIDQDQVDEAMVHRLALRRVRGGVPAQPVGLRP